MKKLIPFILSLGGVLSDYMTTIVGLGLGFYEMNPAYHPLKALLVFWGLITALTVFLPKEKITAMAVDGVSLMSYLGVVNNTLVILGIFSGLKLT